MPIYDRRCPHCGYEIVNVFEKMNTPNPKCPNERCSGELERVPTLPHTDLSNFAQPIEMFSVAEQDLDKIRELQRRCPDAKISDDPRDPMYGVPIAPNRKAKKEVLKAQGFVEKN